MVAIAVSLYHVVSKTVLTRFPFLLCVSPTYANCDFRQTTRRQTKLHDPTQASRTLRRHGWAYGVEHHAHGFHHRSVCHQAHSEQRHGRGIRVHIQNRLFNYGYSGYI